ncbi:MAG: HNH endonuclease [Cohaesibacteraceae bacterium]|nr:HNH endonuclease [Cohaesibacteraceae bacterium]MBL4876192.1 HNH endonuclease [Cohaesibacteraceae bacterium]
MPKRKPRNYKKEYEDYHSKSLQIKRRAGRNKARSLMIKKHGKTKLKGKEVDHKNFNAQDNRLSNLSIKSRRANRRKQPKRS